MPFWLDENTPVPDPRLADEDGLLAVGGSLSAERLIEAYSKGVFPWFSEGDPVLWWSPDPRMVLFPEKIKVSKSMRQWFRRHAHYRFTRNQAFERVIEACATVERKGQAGTWITAEMREAYVELHKRGLAVSYEVWNEAGELRGGLYGVDLGNGIFSGESMFHLEPDVSKAALIYLCQTAEAYGYRLIDAQVYTDHLASMGAELISREEFLAYLGI